MVTRTNNRKDKKFRTDTCNKLIAYLRAGNFITTALRAAGVTKTAYYRWMIEGAEEIDRLEKGHPPNPHSTPYMEFYLAVNRACAESEADDVKTISEAAETQWQAAAWRLERKFKGRWGKLTQISGNVSNKKDHDSTSTMSDEELLAVIIQGKKRNREG